MFGTFKPLNFQVVIKDGKLVYSKNGKSADSLEELFPGYAIPVIFVPGVDFFPSEQDEIIAQSLKRPVIALSDEFFEGAPYIKINNTQEVEKEALDFVKKLKQTPYWKIIQEKKFAIFWGKSYGSILAYEIAKLLKVQIDGFDAFEFVSDGYSNGALCAIPSTTRFEFICTVIKHLASVVIGNQDQAKAFEKLIPKNVENEDLEHQIKAFYNLIITEYKKQGINLMTVAGKQAFLDSFDSSRTTQFIAQLMSVILPNLFRYYQYVQSAKESHDAIPVKVFASQHSVALVENATKNHLGAHNALGWDVTEDEVKIFAHDHFTLFSTEDFRLSLQSEINALGSDPDIITKSQLNLVKDHLAATHRAMTAIMSPGDKNKDIASWMFDQLQLFCTAGIYTETPVVSPHTLSKNSSAMFTQTNTQGSPQQTQSPSSHHIPGRKG